MKPDFYPLSTKIITKYNQGSMDPQGIDEFNVMSLSNENKKICVGYHKKEYPSQNNKNRKKTKQTIHDH